MTDIIDRIDDPPRRSANGEGRKPCIVDGCTRLRVGKGLCSMHWQRAKRRGGDPGPAGRVRRKHTGITYTNTHDLVRRTWGSASQYPCVNCSEPARDWAYDGTDPTQLYLPNHNDTGWHLCSIWPEFYMPMCRRCHNRRDGALAKRDLHEYRLLKYGKAS